jgi:hypothetical protein
MPEIQLNGKTIATQTGTNEPVLKNNVVMESGFSIPSGVTFPAGHVIQVVSATNTTQYIPSSSYANQVWNSTGTNATITPKYTSSQIFILVRQSYFWQMTGAQGVGFRIYRDTTQITSENGYSTEYQDVGATGQSRKHGYTTLMVMDSPNTTSPVNYNVYGSWWASVPEGSQVLWQYGGWESESRILLMEFSI